MTLSSFLLRPSQTAFISGAVSGSVITASPAILTGFIMGNAFPDAPASVGSSAQYTLQINSGANTIIRISVEPYIYTLPIYQPPTGIDCPNGITVTTSAWTGSASSSNARVTINYILK